MGDIVALFVSRVKIMVIAQVRASTRRGVHFPRVTVYSTSKPDHVSRVLHPTKIPCILAALLPQSTANALRYSRPGSNLATRCWLSAHTLRDTVIDGIGSLLLESLQFMPFV